MKAAILEHAPGSMRIEEIPIPAPLEGEVLVKVHACGVCHTDLHVIKAEVAFPTPAVLGHEISGTIVPIVFARHRERVDAANARSHASAVGTWLDILIGERSFEHRVERQSTREKRCALAVHPNLL